MPAATPPTASSGKCRSRADDRDRGQHGERAEHDARARSAGRCVRISGTASSHDQRRPRRDARPRCPTGSRARCPADRSAGRPSASGSARRAAPRPGTVAHATSAGQLAAHDRPDARARSRPRRRTRGEPSASPKSGTAPAACRESRSASMIALLERPRRRSRRCVSAANTPTITARSRAASRSTARGSPGSAARVRARGPLRFATHRPSGAPRASVRIGDAADAVDLLAGVVHVGALLGEQLGRGRPRRRPRRRRRPTRAPPRCPLP